MDLRKAWYDGEIEVKTLLDEIERLRTRLEIIPGHDIDGIRARDETIRIQDAEITRLRTIEKAARNLIAVKGRHHTEIAFANLALMLRGEKEKSNG